MPKGTPGVPFPRVAAAREALRERAVEIIETYLAVIAEARAAENYEVAAQALQWLMEHMPTTEEGSGLIDISIDKPKQIEKPSGPSINIGFALGGMNEVSSQKVLPKGEDLAIEAEVVKVEDIKKNE